MGKAAQPSPALSASGADTQLGRRCRCRRASYFTVRLGESRPLTPPVAQEAEGAGGLVIRPNNSRGFAIIYCSALRWTAMFKISFYTDI